MKGIYVLLLKIEKEKNIKVGNMGEITFEKAYYAYVGSAMSGIHRLKRHIKNLKKGNVKNKHWHIDFIIPYCRFKGWFFTECSNPGKEKDLAIFLSKKLDYVEGFGASDSPAPSHLFKESNFKRLKNKLTEAFKAENLKINTKIKYP